MGFGNVLGLYALLSLIPLIILYLRRPRPVDKTIPSLMFFMKQTGARRQHSLFKKLLRNLLFLFQLLALIALAFAIASPFINVPGKASTQETVIVLDVSASSQAKYESGTRFDAEIAAAKKSMEGKISIILAENVPIVVLEHGNRAEAGKILSSIKPKDTTSNVGEAMLLASDLLEGKHGKVVVLSDFITTEGPDPLVAKRALTSKELDVEFVNVASEVNNVGIIDLSLGKDKSKVFVKNYNNEDQTVNLDIISGGRAKRYEKSILANSIETFVFDTPTGTSKLELEEDGFSADNVAFISAPDSRKITVLLITNAETSYVEKALAASPDIDLRISKPPIIPSLDAQVIVMHDFSTNFLVPGFYKDLKKKISNGTSLVITSQQDISQFDKDLLPVKVSEDGKASTTVINIVNQLTKDITFGVVSKYMKAEVKDGALSLVSTEDGSPMLAVTDYGDGQVVYYGFFDGYSEFKGTTTYPIFWNNLMTFLTGTESLADFNVKTGKVEVINKQTVDTPYGSIKTSKVFFDKAGIYTIGDRKIAASLLSQEESDVSAEQVVVEEEKDFFLDETREIRSVGLELVILVFALIIIISELLYVKSRGDL